MHGRVDPDSLTPAASENEYGRAPFFTSRRFLKPSFGGRPSVRLFNMLMQALLLHPASERYPAVPLQPRDLERRTRRSGGRPQPDGNRWDHSR